MSDIRYCYVCKKPVESNQSRIYARIDNRAHYIHRKCGTEATQKPDPSGSAGFELLSASNDPEKLRMALRNLLDASKPYLRRKKMTPRNDCAFLNSAHEKGEKLLAT